MTPPFIPYRDLSEKIEALQNMQMSIATGGHVSEVKYRDLREDLTNDPTISDKLPRFIRTCGDLKQFWVFIKQKSKTYHGRREYISEQFRPIISENRQIPHGPSIVETLSVLNSDYVHEIWHDALLRTLDDPDGAITSSRTLLETVCKHILDEIPLVYEHGISLPKLYKMTTEALDIAPSQQTEPILKQVLGGCSAVIVGIGAMRNALGDAHGKGRLYAKPDARHAELAVNLAGACSIFLIRTWEEKRNT